MKTKNNFKSVPYQGSKAKLLSFIDDSVEHYLESIGEKQKMNTFFDAFSGSGQVAYHFKKKFDVITNDKQSFTKVINDTFLCSNSNIRRIEFLINELNNLDELYFYKTDGWFTQTYSQDFLDGSAVDLNDNRKVWLTKNARKIDMIRSRIDEMRDSGEINQDEMNVLLTSLLRASNLCANCMGHQNSYLKNWADKALKDLVLLVPVFEPSNRNHKNLSGDIFDVLDDVSSDIAYFDPPYGSNNTKGAAFSYSAYYHLNNTIVTNDRPETFGRASRPVATKAAKGAMEKNKKEIVMPQFVELVKRSKSKLVCFSYSTQGLLTPSDFEEVFRLGGCDMNTFKVYYTNHKKNKQSLTALKNGNSINRDNHDNELYELFIIARKKSVCLVESQTTQEKVEAYLQKSVSKHSISDKSYSIYYDNEEGIYNEKTTGDISMTNIKFNFKRETSMNIICNSRSKYILEMENKKVTPIAINRLSNRMKKNIKRLQRKNDKVTLVSMHCPDTDKQIGFYIEQVPHYDQKCSILGMAYINPDFRNKGHFKSLIEHFEAQSNCLRMIEINPNEVDESKLLYSNWDYSISVGGLLPTSHLLVKESDLPKVYSIAEMLQNAA